jgi:hypothetical protein
VKNHCPLQRRLLRGDKIGLLGLTVADKITLLGLFWVKSLM